MTIASEILKAQKNLKDCYDVCGSVDGVVLPEEKNFDNLSALIEQALDPLNKPPFNKPADWADIRTDCPENSIALYAGHTADYSQYDNLGFIANCVGGYNVFIDGTQYGSTYASGSKCSIIWSTSGITTGDDIITPKELKAHKIWICPAVEGNDITLFRCSRVAESGTESQGILWAHFNITNTIDISYAFNNNSTAKEDILKAVTAKNNILTFSGSLLWSINYNSNCEYIPVLNQNSLNYISANQWLNSAKIKKLIVKNFKPASLQLAFAEASSLTSINYKEWDLSKCKFVYLPSYTNYKNVDLTNNNVLTKFSLYGNSTKPATLKSLRVSNEAPFNGTAPQINVNYTGLDRAALVQLFEDLPYNVGYNVVGSPTIVDGVASGFSASDYCSFSREFIDSGEDLELCVTFTTNTIANKPIFGVTNSYNSQRPLLSLYSSGTKVKFKIANGVELATGYSVSTGVKYKAIVARSGITYTLKLYSGEILLDTQKLTSETLIGNGASNTFAIGFDRASYNTGFNNGSIDLNETYIKVNDVYWFKGQPTMTKTLSCVGATGTADLTEEDKNIALNKGWAITIS